MSKKNSDIYSGDEPEDIIVNSNAYGRHRRKPRGTYKPISLNESFQKSVALNKLVNPVAKAIKDALLRLRTEPTLAPHCATNARRRVEQNFTWRTAQQRLLEAYRRLGKSS